MKSPYIAAITAVAMLAVAGCASQNAAVPPPASGSSATPSASASTDLGVSQRTNNFQMTAGQGITKVGFTWSGSYSITANQQSTWGGVQGCGPSSPCTIVVTAGRHDSSTVWKWFASNAPAYGCTESAKCAGNTSMNFAFTGTLTIDGSSYPVTIGQAGVGTTINEINVWWFGGSGWNAGGTPTGGSAVTPDGKYTISGNGSQYQAVVKAS